jgi:Fe-S-cluster containining protein
LEETRAGLEPFSVQTLVDRSGGRTLHLIVSALPVDLGDGRCPALDGVRCGIYEARPLSCRTVPLHYSRPASSLARYLDGFVRTAGYACDTSAAAPVVTDGFAILDDRLRAARDEAIGLAAAERPWKAQILAAMRKPRQATAHGLPTLKAVLKNAEAGRATSSAMMAAWSVAAASGLLSADQLDGLLCIQAELIAASVVAHPQAPDTSMLRDMLHAYGGAPAERREARPERVHEAADRAPRPGSKAHFQG